MNLHRLEVTQIPLQHVLQDKLEHQEVLVKIVLQDILAMVVMILDVCHAHQDGNATLIRMLLQNVQTMNIHIG